MDLTYMPGELDYKNNKTGGIDMKREHDSVDDFEHLDPELSPGEALSKDFPGLDKDDVKPEGPSTKMLSIDHDILKPLIEASSEEVSESFTKPASSLAGNVVSSHDLITDFDSELRPSMTNLGSDSAEKSDLLDFGVGESVASNSVNPNLVEDKLASNSFISAEMESKIFKTENESDLPITSLESKSKENIKDIEGSFSTMDDSNVISLKDNDTKSQEFDSDTTKSMKEADALSQYDRKETVDQISTMGNDQEVFFKTEEQVPKPQTVIPTPEAEPSKLEPPKEQSKVHEEDKSPEKDKPFIAICPSKPTSATTEPTTKTTEKTSVSDLDDIIGPEDVFKRIGLVEALVYWRDPKKSGVVFGGIMAILLSLCYMSLISVVAYSSMLALTGTICFRIYKNILQAVQKTSEGHPFKEFLDLELSLPQDKVREMVDTAVVHVNASIVELRRLFLVEDLIDSIKFGVCLWCLTYVGAIFNGMTLVILAFVALFTVPKIYENNKASIDTYIEMGRSKVEEITSKVKAAVPIGKKEPEKDKEQ